MAKCSRSSAPARETHARASSNAVLEIRPALITLASGFFFQSWYTSPDERAGSRVYAGRARTRGEKALECRGHVWRRRCCPELYTAKGNSAGGTGPGA